MITQQLMACIRASALYYGNYKKWAVGDPQVRGFYMHIHMRDIVLLCALYNVERRKLARLLP